MVLPVFCVRAMLVGGLLVAAVGLSTVEEGTSQAAFTSSDDELEFAAIKAIHWHLDDNADGTVDVSESDKFVHTELHEVSEEKSHRFHEKNQAITSEDLWRTWHQNKVFQWTNDDVIFWLEGYVELPQYSEVFRKHNITGRVLPSVANNTRQILQTVLQITDGQHRQKIQLRAMDVVLFGPPNAGYFSYWKDAVLVLSSTLCLLGLLYALRQRQVAQSRIDTFLENTRVYEKELSELKEKLEQQEECDGSGGESSPEDLTLSLPESEETLSDVSLRLDSEHDSLQQAREAVETLQRRVSDLEAQLRDSHASHSALQSLLQASYCREWEHLNHRKRAAEEEVTQAHKACDKIKRRRSSLIGTLRLANSSTLEDAGLQITIAVSKMQRIANSLNEFHKRWRKIEQVASVTVTTDTSAPHSLTHVTSTPHPLTHFTSAPHLNTLDRDAAPMSAPPTLTTSYSPAFSAAERRDSDSSSSFDGDAGRPASIRNRRRQTDTHSCSNHQLSASTKDSSGIPSPKPAPGLRSQNETQNPSGQTAKRAPAPLVKRATVPLIRQNSYSEAMDSIGTGPLMMRDVDSDGSTDKKTLPSRGQGQPGIKSRRASDSSEI